MNLPGIPGGIFKAMWSQGVFSGVAVRSSTTSAAAISHPMMVKICATCCSVNNVIDTHSPPVPNAFLLFYSVPTLPGKIKEFL
jgi:hypothetical protein